MKYYYTYEEAALAADAQRASDPQALTSARKEVRVTKGWGHGGPLWFVDVLDPPPPTDGSFGIRWLLGEFDRD